MIEVIRTPQRIIGLGLLENFTFDPEQVERFFTDNFLQRTISHLIAWDGANSRRLVCTAAGTLRVADIGAGYGANITKDGTSTTAEFEIDLLEEYSRFDFLTETNDIKVKIYNISNGWSDFFSLPKDTLMSKDCVASKLKVKSRVAGVHGVYEFVCWK